MNHYLNNNSDSSYSYPQQTNDLNLAGTGILPTLINTSNEDKQMTTIKCMFLGDSGVGKTSLVVSYTENGYPHEHKPTAFDNYSVEFVVDGKEICLQIYDTGGQLEVKSLRQLSMNECQVFLLCFSVMQPNSFHSLKNVWLTEIKSIYSSKAYSQNSLSSGSVASNSIALQQQHPQSQPNNNFCCILVGCQCDLRNDVARVIELTALGQSPIDEEMVRSLAPELGAVAYVECSALTQKNLKILFDLAITKGLKIQRADLRNSLNDSYKLNLSNGAIPLQSQMSSIGLKKSKHNKSSSRRSNSTGTDLENGNLETNSNNCESNRLAQDQPDGFYRPGNQPYNKPLSSTPSKSGWRKLFCFL